jgi:hypothetical protein
MNTVIDTSARKGIFRDRRVPLEDFPGLFAMEGHTGAFGLLFCAVWFILLYFNFGFMWNSQLIILSLLIGFGFLGLLWGSFTLSGSVAEKIRHARSIGTTGNNDRLEIQVRRYITLLSGAYVVVCCFLIFLTGGATSPFTPFFIMIFTLTIAKNKIRWAGVVVLLYFLLAILLACGAARLWSWPITARNMQTIRESGFQTSMHILFICASLVVPTLSVYFLERKEEEVRLAGKI